MNRLQQASSPAGAMRGPNLYFGFCRRSGRYRMMDLADYMSSMGEGVSRFMNDGVEAYNEMLRGYGARGATVTRADAARSRADCLAYDDCHCECCVCDTDVLVHGRCGEVRRIPITFENPSRREKPVKLELGEFVSAGGADHKWPAKLSETEFTLRPCDEHTVYLTMQIRCPRADEASADDDAKKKRGKAAVAATSAEAVIGRLEGLGSVDRCEVGYATIRAEGCLTRPIVVAVAVLPDDCDSYRYLCGCTCCH